MTLLDDYLTGAISYQLYMDKVMAEVGTRVLVAVEIKGEGWTIMDRDTKEWIGSFGILSRHDTREEALIEAERFGSKWDWPTDREWTEDE